MASPITAANAYAKLARLADPGANPLKESAGDSGGPSFGAMVKDAINSVVETGRKSDGLAQGMAAGKANIVDVVQSVNAAELTLDTVVAVRDKVVAAYQSIMNMPI